MTWTIDTALQDDAIERFEKTFDGFSIWLKDIPVEIKISLSVNGIQGGFNYIISHAIKTPEQAGPYRSDRPWGDYDAYALHMAVASVADPYNSAVKNGYQPAANWLIPY